MTQEFALSYMDLTTSMETIKLIPQEYILRMKIDMLIPQEYILIKTIDMHSHF